MAAIDDLNAAVAQIGTDVKAALTEITTLQAAGNNDAAIESAVQTLQGIDAAITAVTNPPAPAP